MANNKSNKQSRGLLDQSRNRQMDDFSRYLDSFRGRIEPGLNEAQGLKNQIRDKYTQGFMPEGLRPGADGFFDLSALEKGGGFGGGGAAFDPTGDYASARKGYQQFADTGGRENFGNSEAAFKGFLDNGGIGEGEAAVLRSRAADSASSLYNNLKAQNIRRRSVQGGYSPGFDAAQKEATREGGRSAAEALRLQEGDIVGRRQQGRQFGASGLYGVDSSVQGGKLSGLGGLSNIGESATRNAQFNAGLGDAAAARKLGFQRDLLGMYQDSGKASAGGLLNLYNSAPGDVGQLLQYGLGGLNSQYGLANQNLGTRGQIQDRSWMDFIPAGLGLAGSIFGSMGGGYNPSDRNGGYGGGYTGNPIPDYYTNTYGARVTRPTFG